MRITTDYLDDIGVPGPLHQIAVQNRRTELVDGQNDAEKEEVVEATHLFRRLNIDLIFYF